MRSAGLIRGWVALFFVVATAITSLVTHTPAEAQLVDTPQNLLKAWTDAYASRQGEPMTRVYARDAQFWGIQSKEPSIGIDSIKQHFDRTAQGVTERSATITKMQLHPRKRLTTVTGTMEVKSKLRDGTVRNNQTRFSMSIIRESRRQWAILNHHVSLMPTN